MDEADEALSGTDMLDDEIVQRRETGYGTSDVERSRAELPADAPPQRIWELVDALEATQRTGDRSYVEPGTPDDIRSALPEDGSNPPDGTGAR
jgi:hypothetical protein